jgi:CBS domain-containing protein
MSVAQEDFTAKKTVGSVMTTDLVTLKLYDTLRLADDLMNLANLRHFPVLDGDKLAGIINQSDLLHASMLSLVHHPKDSPREALGAVAVEEVMKSAATVSSDTSIYEAARMIVERGIECLLVMKGEKLAGLVSRTDLLRELARREEGKVRIDSCA